LGYSGHSLVFSSSNSAPAAAIRYLQKKLLFLLTLRQWPLFVILLKNDCFSNSAPAAAICYPRENDCFSNSAPAAAICYPREKRLFF
jgi:hypothetical protein